MNTDRLVFLQLEAAFKANRILPHAWQDRSDIVAEVVALLGSDLPETAFTHDAIAAELRQYYLDGNPMIEAPPRLALGMPPE